MIFYWIYNYFFFFLSPFLFVWFFFSSPSSWRERYGFFPPFKGKTSPLLIWTSSLGEVKTFFPLYKKIKEKNPQLELVILCFTSRGYRVAKKLFPSERIFYAPLDLPQVMRRFLRRLNPSLILLLETELWPNLLRLTKELNIPVTLINGRISPLRFPLYRLGRPLFKKILSWITLFLMQSEKDRERIISLGAPLSQTKVVGNLKFDQIILPPQKDSLPLFIAGSIHRGELKKVVRAFSLIQKKHPLSLVIAPRYLKDIPWMERKLRKEGFEPRRWRENSFFPGRNICWLVDTLGTLSSLYGKGRLAFVGGSFIPRGGHNILEPLSLGKPTFFGPHMENFEAIASLFPEGKVKDEKELAEKVNFLLSSPSLLAEEGKRARERVKENTGVSEKYLEYLNAWLS